MTRPETSFAAAAAPAGVGGLWRSAWLAAGGLLIVGVLLRVAFLGQQGLWFDEGVGLVFSTCDTPRGCLDSMLAAHSSERFQFVYPLLLHFWRAAFGSSEEALRSLSVLFGVAALPLIWLSANRLYGTTASLWSLAFAATSAFAVFHAQEARPYTLFLFLAALEVELVLRMREARGRGVFWGLLAVSGFASWVGLFPLMFTAALALGDLAARRWSGAEVRRWLARWLPIGLVCVPAAAYYVMAAIHVPPEAVGVPKSSTPVLNLAFVIYGQLVGQTFGPPVEDLRGPDRLSALRESWPFLLALGLLAAAAGLRLLALARRGRLVDAREDGLRFVAASAGAFLVLSFAFAVGTRHNWLPRHAVALHPLACLLVPLLVRSAAVFRRRSRTGVALASGLIALNLVSLAQHYFNPQHWKDDYRGVAQFLQQNAQGRPVILARGMPVLLRYYADRPFVDASMLSVADLRRTVAAATGQAPSALVILNRAYDFDSPAALNAALGGDYRISTETTLRYVSVLRVERARP